MKEKLLTILTAITAFFSRYWLFIIGGCLIVLTVLYFSLPQEVATSKREDKAQIKDGKNKVKQADKAIAALTDTIKRKEVIITRIKKNQQVYVTQDSLLKANLDAELQAGADTRTAAGLSYYLNHYVSPDSI